VTVNLYLNGGSTPVASTVTAADGSYSFSNLGPGAYSVQEVLPAGSTQTGGNAGYTISATSGSNSTGNNFDNFQNINISGTKYNDITGNSFSADDIGQGGVTVNLYLNGGSTAVASTVTAANGSYSFSNLGPGTYSVQEVVPAGSTQTGGNAGYTIVATSGSNSTGNNFDNFQNINISGTKYNDITGNSFSADDTGLGGVTINLYKNGGSTAVASTVTAANGSYSFSNLGPGSYSVQEVVPAGSTQTGGNAGYAIVATSGSNSTGNNFDDFQNICISGTKYNDLTGNSFSADDTGLGGVTINLYKNGGSTAVASTVTAANGSYSFTNLGPGTYSVQEVVPAGSTQTGGIGGYSISATSGGNYTGKNFDDFQNINISGYKYTDITGNSFSADDTGLGGVTINLYKNGGSTAVASTTTAANGSYSFSNLGPGTYSVQEVVPAGWTQTGGNAGYSISATSGTNATGKNFDDFQNISISGTKYKDITGNSFSADDTGLGGVTINLYKNGGSTAVASTTTAANGTYSFTNLGPGTYSVQEVVPSGWTQTGGIGGYSISATSGGNYTGKNFDDFQNGTITGNKYLDITGNGFSSDDTGLGGVTIKLFKDVNNDGALTSADGNAVASTTTAANGSYSFGSVGAGKYFVQEVVPTGYVQTAGGPNGTVGNTYYTVVVQSGQSSTGNNFDDFEADCAAEIAKMSNIKYLINGTTTVTDLRGNTHQGDLVQVTFTIAAGTPPHQLTLVSYTAPGATFDANTASQQQVFDYDTGVFGPGTYTLEVLIPNSYYQVDFICDGYIDHFGSANSNIFYGNEGRLISADNGGTSAKLSNGASLAGSVFVDAANNGIHDASDIGIGLAKVTLTGTDNSNHAVSLTQYTKADGTYLFNNLAAGKYTIKETQPTGFTDGTDILGSLSGTLGNDQFSNITVAASANGTKYDFGEKTPSTSNCAASLAVDPGDSTKAAVIINGTSGCDVIKVTYSSSKYVVTSNGVTVGSFANSLSGKAVDRIIVNGGTGNDCITIDGSVGALVVSELYGGDGCDTLTGNTKGSNILVGGNGKDVLIGGDLRDVIIGGNGADTINGGAGDDLIVAGSTAFDANQAALRLIFAEWNSTRDYTTRLNNIFGTGSGTRLNGSNFLSLANVFDDGRADSVTGGAGQDWYLANNDAPSSTFDSMSDVVAGEILTDID
jgi:protocatechuate 3,4-dioxygenase beta subunit